MWGKIDWIIGMGYYGILIFVFVICYVVGAVFIIVDLVRHFIGLADEYGWKPALHELGMMTLILLAVTGAISIIIWIFPSTRDTILNISIFLMLVLIALGVPFYGYTKISRH